MTVTITKADNGYWVTQTNLNQGVKRWIMDNFGEVIVFLAKSFDEVDFQNSHLDYAKVMDGIINDTLPSDSDTF